MNMAAVNEYLWHFQVVRHMQIRMCVKQAGNLPTHTHINTDIKITQCE